jgi:hypothetical protein
VQLINRVEEVSKVASGYFQNSLKAVFREEGDEFFAF